MQPNFELQLEEREPDRVWVSVLLGPGPDGLTEIDGVTVALVGRGGEALSHRLLLPIAGRLTQAIVSTVELRAVGPLPQGARVLGSVWRGAEQWEASCPADPGTQMEDHVRGRVALRPISDEAFEDLSCEERAALAEAFPWIEPCARDPEPEPRVVESEPDPEPADPEELRRFCKDLGLCDDDAEWLESLLDEE